jgi:hypothetical protein
VPPRTAWKLVNLVFWVTSMAVAVVFSLIIGLNIVLAPAAIMIGMAIGSSARRVNSWTCELCGAELMPRELRVGDYELPERPTPGELGAGAPVPVTR